MKTLTRILSLLLALAVATPAYSLEVNGQLKNARLENQSSAPSSTAVGRIYYDTTEAKAKIYNGSGWQSVGSGSGTSGNLITNGDAEDAAVPSGWATYDEGTSAAAVDGTGDHADANAITAIARETDSGDLISGSGSWRLAAGASSQGEGWAYSFTIPANSYLKNALNEISFGYYMSTAATSDLFRVYVYDVTNGTLITPSFTSCGGGSTPSLTSTTTPCAAKLSWVATTGTSYRFLIHAASNTAATLYIDDIFVGQRGVQVGPGESEPVSYTLTIGGSTAAPTPHASAISSATWTRNGRWMTINYQFFQSSGGTSGTGTYLFPLPAGYTIDSSVIPSGYWGASGQTAVGEAEVYATATLYDGTVKIYDSTRLYLQAGNDTSSQTTVASTSYSMAAPYRISFVARVPIAEWAGGVAYGENPNCEYAYNNSTTDADDTTSFAYGPGGGQYANFTANRSKRVRFQSAIQPTDLILIKVTSDGGVTWSVLAGNVAAVSAETTQNTSRYGISWQPVNVTDVDIRFGGAGRQATGATFGAAGASWADVDVSSTYKYRVEKCRGGQAVGFGLASATEPGLVSREITPTSYTPVLSGCSGGTTSISSVRGSYSQIGKLVFYDFSVFYSQSGSPTGTINISLPKTATADSGYFVLSGIDQNQSNEAWFSKVVASGTTFTMKTGSTYADITCAGVTTNRTFKGTIIYRVDN